MQRRPFRMFVIAALVLFGGIVFAGLVRIEPAAGQAGTPGANIVGSWSLNWRGAQDTYAGKLDVLRSLGPNRYYGKLTLLPGKGGVVTEEARITVNGSQVDIECYNPSRRGWNPDRFYLTLSGTVMEGFSIDTAGQRGSQITFTRL